MKEEHEKRLEALLEEINREAYNKGYSDGMENILKAVNNLKPSPDSQRNKNEHKINVDNI